MKLAIVIVGSVVGAIVLALGLIALIAFAERALRDSLSPAPQIA